MKLKSIGANKTVFLNFSSVALLQGIAFLTAPIFTRILGPDQYGMYSVFNAWVSVVGCFMGCCVGGSLSTARYNFKDEYLEYKSSVLLLGTLLCSVVFVIGMLFSRQIQDKTQYSNGLIVFLFAAAMSRFISQYAQTAWVYEKKSQINFCISLFTAISSVILSLILLHFSESDKLYQARILGSFIPYIIIAVCVWTLIFFSKPTAIKKRYSIYALSMGCPLIFHTLSQSVLIQSDRVMMQYLHIEMSEIGKYSVFYALSSVLATLLGALNTSWTPFYYDDLDNKQWDTLNKKSLHYIELFSILTCGFILIGREVGLLYSGAQYQSAVTLLPILAISVFFQFMYQFPVNFELFHRKTNIIAMGTIFAAFSNIILNILLIPKYGISGAAIATALSYLVLFLAHYYFATHMKDVYCHIQFSKFFPAFLAVALCSLLFYVFRDLWVIRWIIAIVIGASEVWRIYKRGSIF